LIILYIKSINKNTSFNSMWDVLLQSSKLIINNYFTTWNTI